LSDTLHKLVGRLACVGLSVVLTGPVWNKSDQPSGLQRLEQTEEAMGSSFSVVLFGPDRPRLESAAGAAFVEAHRLDRLLSNYRADTEWSAMNREAGSRPVRVSPELFALLSACQEYSRRSEGAFDISVGPLMRIWGFYKDEGRMPLPSEVRTGLTRVGYEYVRLDPEARTVTFLRQGIELDPGGIGKGYAVDRMIEVIRGAGVDTALVSASGSSIYGLGAPPEDPRGWAISIRAPRDPNGAAAQVLLRNMSLSTSGAYEKFFQANGRTYSHIVDPRTGYPAQGVASVSVVAPHTIDSEAWTKPFFVKGRAWTKANRPSGYRVFFCSDGIEGACSWVE
jgi:thiamine biosynthesis lipoprotein